jgi:deoxyribonuclease-4
MLHIGCHLSCADGYFAMGKEAVAMGADTFAFFTRNPRGGNAKPIDHDDVKKFLDFSAEHNFVKLVAHAPYTLNPCAARDELRAYAYKTMLDDLKRLSFTPGNFYNFHPGSHVQQGSEKGISLTADFIARICAAEQGFIQNEFFTENSKITTTILVETMAGKGSEIGRTFEEIKSILDSAEEKYLALTSGNSGAEKMENLLGVCMDTCHIWDGGYDISKIDDVMENFAEVVGLNRLKAVHLNDSMNGLNSHKDRHQKIGEGCIGLENLVAVTNHSALKNLPFILETPNEFDGYKNEIALLRSRFVE